MTVLSIYLVFLPFFPPRSCGFSVMLSIFATLPFFAGQFSSYTLFVFFERFSPSLLRDPPKPSLSPDFLRGNTIAPSLSVPKLPLFPCFSGELRARTICPLSSKRRPSPSPHAGDHLGSQKVDRCGKLTKHPAVVQHSVKELGLRLSNMCKILP